MNTVDSRANTFKANIDQTNTVEQAITSHQQDHS